VATALERALDEFDRINAADPRAQRELIFSRRVFEWVLRLNPQASESAQLAARAHTVRRWEVPRDRYPMDTGGYHAWRAATAAHSADAAAAVLQSLGYPGPAIDHVGRLIRRELAPQDQDAQLLEDADCLAFLELKLTDYLERWDEEKLARILHGTLVKMSPAARRVALGLPLDSRVGALLRMAG